MTLDNDGNPQAPRLPSDPPPRRSPADGAQTEAEGVAAPARSPVEAPSKSADTGDATTPRAIVRAILAALPLPLRAAVVAAVLAWARSLAAVAGMVARRELSPAAALALTDAAAETLVEADDAPPHDVDGFERVGRLARVTAPSALPAELVSGDTRAMLGGTGGARAAAEFRARFALDAAAEVMARQSTTDAERERLAFGRARVEACNAALALRASGAHDATGAELEAELAAAMDAAALVLSYLAA